MRRHDLPGLVDVAGPGTMVDAVVRRHHPARGVVELACAGGTLIATGAAPEGSAVRARIPARDVMLATSLPGGLSVQNVLAGVVQQVVVPGDVDAAMVDVAIGGLVLTAEVTRDAVARLALVPGRPVFALVKAVSIDLAGGSDRRRQ